MSEQTERNKEIIRRYQEAYNSGDLDVLDELLAPDWKSNNFPTAVMEQTIENAKAVQGMLLEVFPDLQITTETLIAEGDHVVQRWTWRGTHKGDFPEAPASGNVIEQGGVSVFRIADGKIVEHWGCQDSLDAIAQMGVEFPAEWLAFVHH